MKNIFFLILLVIVSLPSIIKAQSKNGFILSGDIAWAKEGKVELIEMVLKNDKPISKIVTTAFITNHKFELKADIKKSKIMFLSIMNQDKKKSLNVFLYAENKHIKLVATEENGGDNLEYTGSPTQDFLTSLLPKLDSLEKNIEQYIQANDTTNLNLIVLNFIQYIKEIEVDKNKKELYYFILYGVSNVLPYNKSEKIYADIQKKIQTQKTKIIWHTLLLNRIEKNKNKKYVFKDLDEKFAYTYKTILESTFLDQNNAKINMDSLCKDKYVIINFWASWCGPCRAEIKEMRKIYEKYKNVVVISISVDKDIKKWNDAIKKNNMEWIQLIDDNNFLDKLDIKSIPRSFFIGSNQYLGGGDHLEAYIYDMLKQNIKP